MEILRGSFVSHSLTCVSIISRSRILYYISCIRQFQKMKKALGRSEDLVEKMNGMPKVIIDGLVKRFTETAKGSST